MDHNGKNSRIIRAFAVILTATAVVLASMSVLFSCEVDALTDGSISITGASAAREIKAGDHIWLGNEKAEGFTGLPYWRVLDVDQNDGSLFLMSEYLWTGADLDDLIQFNADRSPEWQGSDAQSWCWNFEAAVLSGIEGVDVLKTTRSDTEYHSDYGDIIFAESENILDGDTVFFLSAEEVYRYMPEREDRIAYLHDGTKKDLAESWWLRSPRKHDQSECVGHVMAFGDEAGMIGRSYAKNLGAARPALRVIFAQDTALTKEIIEDGTVWSIGKEEPGDDPSPIEPGDSIRKGYTFNSGGATYRVISPTGCTAALVKARNASTSTVPGTVKTAGKTFKVVSIEAKAFRGKKIKKAVIGKNVKTLKKNAFSGSKAATVTIKTSNLKKSAVKGCFRSSKVKTVKVSVGKKAQNKKILKAYRKIFTKRITGRKVTVR